MNNIETFGKDHWSLMAYLECRATDNKGTINLDHLRFKRGDRWKQEYGTRLRGYFEKRKIGSTVKHKEYLLTDHDDMDCIDDLEASGLIVSCITGMGNGFVELTDKGRDVAGQIRGWRADGGLFAYFVPVL